MANIYMTSTWDWKGLEKDVATAISNKTTTTSLDILTTAMADVKM